MLAMRLKQRMWNWSSLRMCLVSAVWCSDEYVIDVTTILQALREVKTNKATGPDDVPAWILNNHANTLAGSLTAIFNSSLREGIIPDTWKCNICTESKSTKHNIEKDVRPIYLTPIASKTLESIILNMVNENN